MGTWKHDALRIKTSLYLFDAAFWRGRSVVVHHLEETHRRQTQHGEYFNSRCEDEIMFSLACARGELCGGWEPMNYNEQGGKEGET